MQLRPKSARHQSRRLSRTAGDTKRTDATGKNEATHETCRAPEEKTIGVVLVRKKRPERTQKSGYYHPPPCVIITQRGAQTAHASKQRSDTAIIYSIAEIHAGCKRAQKRQILRHVLKFFVYRHYKSSFHAIKQTPVVAMPVFARQRHIMRRRPRQSLSTSTPCRLCQSCRQCQFRFLLTAQKQWKTAASPARTASPTRTACRQSPP